MKRALLLLALVGCTEDNPVKECPAVTECGEAPLAPGFVASMDNGTVTMSQAVYDGILAWRDEVGMWRDCVTGL